ncbi:MAG: DHH family phosphoesterase [Roseiflexaceae bacterium]
MHAATAFLSAFQQFVTQHQRIWLCLHTSPDLDAVGSNMAMAAWIRHVHPTCVVTIIGADRPSDNILQVLTAYDAHLYHHRDPADVDYRPGDAVVLVDVAAVGRCSVQRDLQLPATVPWAVVDHHQVVAATPLTHIDVSFQSAAALVYQLMQQAAVPFSQSLFAGVVMGVLGDSGFFRFRDTHLIATLTIVQDFVRAHGIDAYYQLVDTLERNRPINDFVIQGLYLATLCVKSQYAYTTLTRAQKRAAGLQDADMHGQNGASLIRNIGSTQFVFAVTEREPGSYSVSFRTCAGSTRTVREFAQALGGGGHPMAAGCEVSAESMAAVVAQVEAVIATIV